jgi:hypothetical protein
MLINLLLSSALMHGTSSGSTSAKDLKQPVNFSGKIATYYQDQDYIVENISVQGKYKDITTYDTPTTHPEALMNNDTKQLEITLDHNPLDDFPQTTLKLEDINSLEVPSPDTVWVYQKKKNQPRQEYLELKVTYKDGTTKSLLLGHKNEIYCYELTAESQRKTIPLSALKKLTIEAFSCQIETKNAKPVCPKNP